MRARLDGATAVIAALVAGCVLPPAGPPQPPAPAPPTTPDGPTPPDRDPARAALLDDEGRQLLEAQRDLDGAAARFAEAVRLDPLGRYYLDLCFAEHQRGRFAEAVAACREVAPRTDDVSLVTRADRLVADAERRLAPGPPPGNPDDGRLAAKLDRSWCAEIYAPFAAEVAGRYPFDPAGPDLPIADLDRWFAPDRGLLWTYYEAELSTLVERTGETFRLGEAGTAASLDPRLPDVLTHVADIGTVLFPPGASAPRFEFDVQLEGTPGTSEITLTVDGATIKYRNGPLSWQPLRWPGTSGAPGARLQARSIGGNLDRERAGAWGFWRLLADATLVGLAGQQEFKVKWDLGPPVGVVAIRLRPRRDETPLFALPSRPRNTYLGLFTSLRLPASLAGGPACPTTGLPADAGR